MPIAAIDQDSSTADCTVVIPTYNERDTVSQLIRELLAHPRLRVLIVDDASPDGTGAIVSDLAREFGRVSLVERSGKLGMGSACVAGFKRAIEEGARFVFQMDADLSHDPRYIPALVEAAETRYDLVLGSRYIEGGGTTDWGLVRRALSRGGNLYSRLALGLTVRDATTGFRCFRRNVLTAIDLDAVKSSGYLFQIEMVYRAMIAGFSIGEIPIVFPDRRVGQSKMTTGEVVSAFIDVWRLRFSSGSRQ
jgi:dolichol-phosphate mannosyltransferase